MTEPRDMRLDDALSGKYGPDVQQKAEQAVKAAVDQIGRMFAGGTIVGDEAKKFAKGGIISPNATFSMGPASSGEAILPHSVGFRPVVVVEGPDGALHGKGNVIASAHASQWRPQDCAPALRRVMFGDKR